MSEKAPPMLPRASRPRRRWLAAVLAIGVLVALALVARSEPTGPALDPESPAADGLLGLNRLLVGLDATVEVDLDPPDDHATRVFVAHDLLDQSRAEAMLDWVADGGVLVVAGPRHRLHDLDGVPVVLAEAFGTSSRRGACSPADALDELTIIHHDWADHRPPPQSPYCFEAPTGAAWLVVDTHGKGRLVVLGSATPFTNRWLDQGDNAAVAVALLAPRPDARVQFVPRPPPGSGDATLLELVPRRAWVVLGLGVFTVLVGIAARARRLGPPPIERLPPVLAGSELTTALAHLRQRARDRTGAAARLREHARQAAARICGLPPGTGHDTLVSRTAAALRVAEDEVEPALLDTPVVDDDGLVEVARAAARIHQSMHAQTR